MIALQHFERFRLRHPQATLVANGDGSHTVTVPDVPLGDGWSREQVAVAFVIQLAIH